ncbi:dephospho-CoA kinase [Alteromonas pelagimontana]|uniref:Dephospho-CoA kinase n=1 Tax=Alteromonas pelagimontana TaxID=1858656 RepID=A0A6M4MA30_9ALTE|nr:dephospho-CoA kinase [Alteromonas pelagimontana]QJR80012.1 dephospho-CoA kinase [Alteromonas pelagimontana]
MSTISPSHKFVVGLTGGIGSGKTAVSDGFLALGVDVIDADIVARQVVEPGSSALKSIAANFGSEILLSDGALNRAALRQTVFSNEKHKKWLNALLHPVIREKMLADIATTTSAYCILAVPLLLENKLNTITNRVLVVDCPADLQLQRALARDGSDETTIKNIMASQISRNARLAAADDIIDNSGDFSALPAQIAALHQQYLELCHGANPTS